MREKYDIKHFVSNDKRKPDGSHRTQKWSYLSKHKSKSKYDLAAVCDRPPYCFTSWVTFSFTFKTLSCVFKHCESSSQKKKKKMEYPFTVKYRLLISFYYLFIRWLLNDVVGTQILNRSSPAISVFVDFFSLLAIESLYSVF